MILRRVIEHVKHQNWTAVALDFVIVVMGVFIGIQVSNWNEARGRAAKEAVILQQLQTEFQSAHDLTLSAKKNNDAYIDAALEVLRVINKNEEPKDGQEFPQTLRQGGPFASVPIEPKTLTELISSGGLSELSSPELRRALIRYHELMIVHQQGANLVLERISTPHDGFHRAVILNPDFQEDGQEFLYDFEWEQLPAAREQFQVLVYGKSALSEQLAALTERADIVLSEIEKAQH